MDLWLEFKRFAKSHGLRPQDALGKIASIRSYRKQTMKPSKSSGPSKSPYYERFIKELPCIGCDRIQYVKAVPLTDEGELGVFKECSSYTCIPLCKKCAEMEVVREQIMFRFREIQFGLLTTYLRCVEGT